MQNLLGDSPSPFFAMQKVDLEQSSVSPIDVISAQKWTLIFAGSQAADRRRIAGIEPGFFEHQPRSSEVGARKIQARFQSSDERSRSG